MNLHTSKGEAKHTSRFAGTRKLLVATLALGAWWAGCSKSSETSAPLPNELEQGLCADKCIKACNADSDCNAVDGELCCDFGSDGKACTEAKECPRQCTNDARCDTANGQACVRTKLETPINVCEEPSKGLRLCGADSDCKEIGDVCCASYKEPLCLPANRCPKTCSNSSACNNAAGEICCTSLPTLDTTLVPGGICVVPTQVSCPTACTQSSDCKTGQGELCCNGLCDKSCQKPCGNSAECNGQVCCKTKATRSPFVRDSKKPGYEVAMSASGGNSAGGGTGAGGAMLAAGGSTGVMLGAGGGAMTMGTGLTIIPNNGFVNRLTNGVGVEGPFYTFNDGVSVIRPATFAAAGASICADGSTVAVPNMNYAMYWGAGIGLNLNQAAGAASPAPYNPMTHGLVGFRFTLEGTAVPDKVLVTIVAPGSSTPYCKVVSGAGTYTVLGNEVRADCNASVPGALLPVGEIEAVQWIVPSNDGAVPFNFCVSNLSVVTF